MADDPSLESTEGAFGCVPDDIEVPRRPQRPIQGSVAGATIASHGSVAVFGHATHRTLDELIQDKRNSLKGRLWSTNFINFCDQSIHCNPGSPNQVPWVFPSAIKKRSQQEQPEGQAYPRGVCL